MSFERIIFALSAITIFIASNSYKEKIEKYNPYAVKDVAPMKMLTPIEKERSKGEVAGLGHKINTENHL